MKTLLDFEELSDERTYIENIAGKVPSRPPSILLWRLEGAQRQGLAPDAQEELNIRGLCCAQQFRFADVRRSQERLLRDVGLKAF